MADENPEAAPAAAEPEIVVDTTAEPVVMAMGADAQAEEPAAAEVSVEAPPAPSTPPVEKVPSAQAQAEAPAEAAAEVPQVAASVPDQAAAVAQTVSTEKEAVVPAEAHAPEKAPTPPVEAGAPSKVFEEGAPVPLPGAPASTASRIMDDKKQSYIKFGSEAVMQKKPGYSISSLRAKCNGLQDAEPPRVFRR